MKAGVKTLTLMAAAAVWSAFAANRVVDLGGGKRAAIFDEPGSFSFIVPDTITGEVSVMIVGGGGGGGGTSGGGGGGGEVIYASGLGLVRGETVLGTVGDGGAGGSGGNAVGFGGNGETTTFTTSVSGLSYKAAGGGGGAGSWGSRSGSDGACGGGAGGNWYEGVEDGGQATVAGGHGGGSRDGLKAGGSYGSGGGGWTAAGGSIREGSCGGAGYTTDISGQSAMYAYGGGGGGWSDSDKGIGGARDGFGDGWKNDSAGATSGRDGTGGGGGGGRPGVEETCGGDGGCGTVIIAYTIDLNQLTVDFTSSTRVGIAPYKALFTCSAEANDLAGVSFTWDFGDGSEPVTTTDTKVSHTYRNWGSHTVSLTVRTATTAKTKTESDYITVYSDSIYVDGGSANPVWPYATEETAATALTNALSAAAMPGQTIRIAPGFYDTRWLTVTNAVRIVGMGANPGDTVLTNFIAETGWSNSRTNWVLIVDNPDALISNIAIEHGVVNTDRSGNFGSCLTIRSGTVSNCVVRGGYLASMSGQILSPRSAGVVVTGERSLLTHTIVSDCRIDSINPYGGATSMSMGAGATVMGGGRAENCLFRDIDTPQGDIVTAVDGELVNVTIADCKVDKWGYGGASTVYEKCYGLCISNGTAIARNVAVVNVRSRDGAEDAGANRAVGASVPVLGSSFINCATDTETPINATCVTGTKATFFKPGTYTPMCRSPLFNAGVNVARFAATVDLDGNPRIVSRKIDIGSYECQTAPGLAVLVR